MDFSSTTFSTHFKLVFFSLTIVSFPLSAASRTGDLDFDKTFSIKDEAPQTHYKAIYEIDGNSHEVEIWRDGSQRLRRRTDDAIETFIFKPAKEVEWRMVVLDRKRRIRTDIDRTNLYRIGHFTDWFSQSHSLTRPVGPYHLQADPRFQTTEKPLSACRWFRLTRDTQESWICWSAKLHLPLLVIDGNQRVKWRITTADNRPPETLVFVIHDEGFARSNANADIQAD